MNRHYQNTEHEIKAGGRVYYASFTYEDNLRIFPRSFDGLTPGTSESTSQELTIEELHFVDEDGETHEVDLDTCYHRNMILKSCEENAIENIGID